MPPPKRLTLKHYKWALLAVSAVLIALVLYVFIWPRIDNTQNNNKVIVVSSPQQQPLLSRTDPVITRDERVVSDPLYPPLSRQSTDNTRALLSEPHLIPVRPNDSHDSYRLTGYLVSQEDRNDTWKLFAREKHSNRGDATFFVSSANRNVETKIPLTPEITAPRLRDLYSLPDQIHIQHPLFDTRHPYTVVQLPPADLASGYI
jgi:hypothetical protein